MPQLAIVIAFVVGAYFLGAIPFGLLIGKAKGVDIREQGSKNIGATNTGRVLGKKWGFFCLSLDILKGLLPTLIYGTFFLAESPVAMDLLFWLLVGMAAVFGHLFPVYLRFKGGKGVATTIGVALGVWPYLTVGMGVSLIGYAALRFGTGKVSIGSLTIAVLFPVAVTLYSMAYRDMSLADCWPLVAVACVLGLLIIVRHRENIQRLIKGQEFQAPTQPK